MDYDDFGQDYDEDDYMDVEEAIEVQEPKKKTDVLNVLDDIADGGETSGLKKGRVEPKARKPGIKRNILTERKLVGPNGIRALIKSFEGYKPPTGGKRPYDDLKDIMMKMEAWAHSVAPNMEFNDFLARTQTLGRKRVVTTHMMKIRNGMEFGPEDEEVLKEEEKTDDEEDGKEKVNKAKPKKKGDEPIHFC